MTTIRSIALSGATSAAQAAFGEIIWPGPASPRGLLIKALALDDAQLRTLEERLRYLRELDERPRAILDSISQQGKLDAALEHAIEITALQAASLRVSAPSRMIALKPRRLRIGSGRSPVPCDAERLEGQRT